MESGKTHTGDWVDMTEPKIFDAAEPLSKALDTIIGTGTSVFVTKNGALFGIIDDRNMRMGILDLSKTKCESASVRCPTIKDDSGIEDRLASFLAGHFKILPVVNAKGRIIGATSRSDLLRDLRKLKLLPNTLVFQRMSTPVYTIDYSKTIGDAKSEMKKCNVHRLVVTRADNAIGILTTFDFAGLFGKSEQRDRFQLISEVKTFDSKRIGDVLRESFASILETATLDEAADKMASESVSSLVVLDGKKPTGILSATDIFKLVSRELSPEREVMVSGLDQENLAYYGKIKEEVLALISKFEKSFKIENIAVHIKKGSRIYEVDVHFDLNNRHVAFMCEGHQLGEALAALSKELKIILEKAKSEKMELKKPPRGSE